jgi:hypothetical protein
MYDDETLIKIQQFRQKMADGTLTEEEAIEAVRMLRGGNARAAAIGGASKARAAKAPVDVGGLMGELEGL